MTTNEVFKKYTDEKTFKRIVEYDSISQMWKNCLNEFGNQNAVCYDGEHLTFSQIENDAARFRSVLKKNGVEKGERLGLLCANSYDFVKAFIAITTSGNSAVIIPAHLDEMSIFGCSMKLGIKKIVVQDALEEKTKLAKSKGIQVIKISETDSESTQMVESNANDECVLMFTGGTTGKSKAAILTNGAVMQGTINGCYGYKDVFNQRYILVLPLSHVFGLIRNLMTSLYTGSEIFICKNNKDMFKDIATFKPTILVSVPALIEMALKLSKQMGISRLSFAEEEYMEKFLDIHPGSVSVLGLMNDKEHMVNLVIDEDVLKEEMFGCHPCENTSSIRFRTKDLTERIIPALDRTPVIVHLEGVE